MILYSYAACIRSSSKKHITSLPRIAFGYGARADIPFLISFENQRIGQDGPLLLQDFHLVDLLSHFDRERIPERVVHAKGAGAHGTFTCTKSLEDICFADCFSKEGLECPITVRFSVSICPSSVSMRELISTDWTYCFVDRRRRVWKR